MAFRRHFDKLSAPSLEMLIFTHRSSRNKIHSTSQNDNGEEKEESYAVVMCIFFAGILTCYFSLGQVLRVPLLASGHRPGIYTGIARGAALEGSALLLLLLYTGRKLAPKATAR